jgi:hypothetical protein
MPKYPGFGRDEAADFLGRQLLAANGHIDLSPERGEGGSSPLEDMTTFSVFLPPCFVKSAGVCSQASHCLREVCTTCNSLQCLLKLPGRTLKGPARTDVEFFSSSNKIKLGVTRGRVKNIQ